MIHIESIDVRLATEADKNIPGYDHTILSAVNTCPTWGLVRYGLHKIMPGAGRAMALEAGGASHECFSAVRLYQFWKHDIEPNDTTMLAAVDFHGERLFGRRRFEQMKSVINETSVERTNVVNFALEALYTSTFYDSDQDKRRTVSNIAEAMIVYIDRFDMKRYPIWVRDREDPKTDIGIENTFDVVVTIKYKASSTDMPGQTRSHILIRRLHGSLDALVFNGVAVMVDENKTGARLDDAWLAQWRLSHQITGYCLAGHVITGVECNKARVVGMRIPIGKVLFEGIRIEQVNRAPFQYTDWAIWFLHSVTMFEQYKDNVSKAPRYTHSCNRYFRPCSLIAYCDQDEQERVRILEEMEHDEWNPLKR